MRRKEVGGVPRDDLPQLAVWSYGYGCCNFRFVTFSKSHPYERGAVRGGEKRKSRTSGDGVGLRWLPSPTGSSWEPTYYLGIMCVGWMSEKISCFLLC